jgi:sugar lactone lactonase YvrE
MRPIRSQLLERSGRNARRRIAAWQAGVSLLPCLMAPHAFAQNAAQQAALARLGLSRTRAHPQNAQPGGVEATTVPLVTPLQLAFDSAGNLYIADSGDQLIREVDLTGIITTVAGSGQEGFSGDGGPAIQAQLDTPSGAAVDANGNLYIADTNNNRIREVSAGVIQTIAGTGSGGFSGDNGPATAAKLDSPTALAIDAQGNLYIADTGNQRIRKIVGTAITTVAGNGIEGFAGDGAAATAASVADPIGVAVDSAGNLYIGDTNNQRVRMVSAATGNITTIAGTGVKGFNGDGPALTIQLASPSGVAVDSVGDVYFADADNDRVREISGGNVSTIAGTNLQGYAGDTGAATKAVLDTPRAVLLGSSSILVSDTANNLVRSISAGDIVSSTGVPAQGSESLIVGGPVTSMHGTGTLTATYSNNSATATGQVAFYDQQASGPVLVGQAQLASNVATISATALGVGTHSIVAGYSGDASNNPIHSGAYIYVKSAVSLTAVAASVNLLYGQAIPTLTGALSGVLAQDSGAVTAVYSTTAGSTSAPGIYPITISLSGSAAANYTVMAGAGSGSVMIAQAPTTITLSAKTTNVAPGANVTLTASVVSTTGAIPAGAVTFYDGAPMLNSTPLLFNNGVATYTTNSLTAGAHSLSVVYSGNADFVGSTSTALAVAETAPDFTISASPSTQSLLPSHSVNYTLTLTPLNPTFLYPVTLTASGLPAGMTATFTPASLAAGAPVSSVQLTLSANAQAWFNRETTPRNYRSLASALALLLPLFFWRHAHRVSRRLSHGGKLLLALLALLVVGVVMGCGGGYFAHPVQSYSVTIAATSGPFTHNTIVNVTLE